MGQGSDRYVLINERGELVIARFRPQGYEEISRAKILEPTNNMASFAGKSRPVVGPSRFRGSLRLRTQRQGPGLRVNGGKLSAFSPEHSVRRLVRR